MDLDPLFNTVLDLLDSPCFSGVSQHSREKLRFNDILEIYPRGEKDRPEISTPENKVKHRQV